MENVKNADFLFFMPSVGDAGMGGTGGLLGFPRRGKLSRLLSRD
jgi:hypothetical protein